jgi:hypothetical protein
LRYSIPDEAEKWLRYNDPDFGNGDRTYLSQKQLKLRCYKETSIKRDIAGFKAAFKGRHTMPTEKRPHSTDHNGFNNPNGRNKRSVWTVSTQGFPDAHFAVFPQELIIPCIKAGCPTTVCAKCGAPYKRIVEKAPATSTLCPKTQAAHEARGGTGTVTGTVGKSGGGRVEGYTKTLGFEPTCECNADIAPGTVLDPFVGSGTTCLTAKQLGRNSIGIDKNDKYLQMAKRRINSI